MIHQYNIEGMTCGSCKKSVEESLQKVKNVKGVAVDIQKKEATVTMEKYVSTEELKAALPVKYNLTEKQIKHKIESNHAIYDKEKSKLQQLKPLFLILFYITVASILMHYQDWNIQSFMLDFMGLFYIVFSFFKMLDLKGFPSSFSMYDPLAKKLPIYAKVYPFIETVLGLMFLLRIQIPIALIITIVVLGITTVGVTKTLLDKKSIKCACLGTALNLPMTEATFIENAIMLVMAILMLI